MRKHSIIDAIIDKIDYKVLKKHIEPMLNKLDTSFDHVGQAGLNRLKPSFHGINKKDYYICFDKKLDRDFNE